MERRDPLLPWFLGVLGAGFLAAALLIGLSGPPMADGAANVLPGNPTLAAGANVTIATNITRGVTVYTVAASGGSGSIFITTNITVLQTLLVSNTITTNLTVINNLFSSNIFTTNLVVFNTIIGSNFITTNLVVFNNFVVEAGGKLTVSNVFATNIYVSNIIAQTLVISNANVYPIEPGTNIVFVTNGGIVTIHGTATGSGSGSTVRTNFINLSVQAAKGLVTNYPAFNNGYSAWETVFYETNAEGSRAVLEATWQFMVPHDYVTNTLQLLINYSLQTTNGPNTSNVIWGASFLLAGRSGTTNNIRTNLFGFTGWGTNEHPGKYDGTNYTTNMLISLGTNAGIQAYDLAVMKLRRDAINDTFGGVASIHGLQLMYTATNF